MKSFYFFSDFNSDLYLLEQSAVDAFGPISQAEFRVNSVHSANNDPTAYAIAAGKVLVQQSQNPDLLNILIKPFLSPTFLPEPVKYFVYRGVKKSSLVSSNALSLEETLLTDSDNDLLQTIVSFGTDEIFPAGLLGLGVDFSELDVDDILVGPQKGDWLYIRPTVKAGDKIGDFDKDHIGIEIILEGRNPKFTVLVDSGINAAIDLP